MRHVAYHHLFAVSPFLLALAVSYFKRMLWCCGQLLPYVGMGSYGTRLHRDCNAMGDAAKIFPCVPFTCAENSILSVLIIKIARRWVTLRKSLLMFLVPVRKMHFSLD
jgi:hypothetical protein